MWAGEPTELSSLFGYPHGLFVPATRCQPTDHIQADAVGLIQASSHSLSATITALTSGAFVALTCLAGPLVRRPQSSLPMP